MKKLEFHTEQIIEFVIALILLVVFLLMIGKS